jgi:starch phosphorylase
MVGGKAAPGYITAKKIIKLINSISDVVNNDPDIGDIMKVVFLPNYCVSAAQVIIPAADLSQQISTAGTEASGTSNMKFVMNGCIIIGTMDGANVEISQEVGEENMFIFGARLSEVNSIRERMSRGDHPIPHELRQVFDTIRSGRIGNPRELVSIIEPLEQANDFYLVCHDFKQYLEAQEKVDSIYRDQNRWLDMSIKGALTMAKFSSDRTIEEYATHIWNLSPVEIPTPSESALNRVRSQPHLFLAQDKLVERRKVITERQDSEFSMLKEEQLDEALRRGELEHELPSYAKTDGEITQDA